jgi:hypothetical protein
MKKRYSLPIIRLNQLLTRINRRQLSKSLDLDKNNISEKEFEVKANQEIDNF